MSALRQWLKLQQDFLIQYRVRIYHMWLLLCHAAGRFVWLANHMTLVTRVTSQKDVLRRCNLPLVICRGQAYDGAANMQGIRNGVASQIQAEIPSAIPVHCLVHCLQLVLQEAGGKCWSLREASEILKEIVQLVNLSTLLAQNLENYEGVVRLKPLCPTPWTIRTKAFSADPVDYVVLQQTMEDISNTTHEPS